MVGVGDTVKIFMDKFGDWKATKSATAIVNDVVTISKSNGGVWFAHKSGGYSPVPEISTFLSWGGSEDVIYVIYADYSLGFHWVEIRDIQDLHVISTATIHIPDMYSATNIPMAVGGTNNKLYVCYYKNYSGGSYSGINVKTFVASMSFVSTATEFDITSYTDNNSTFGVGITGDILTTINDSYHNTGVATICKFDLTTYDLISSATTDKLYDCYKCGGYSSDFYMYGKTSSASSIFLIKYGMSDLTTQSTYRSFDFEGCNRGFSVGATICWGVLSDDGGFPSLHRFDPINLQDQ